MRFVVVIAISCVASVHCDMDEMALLQSKTNSYLIKEEGDCKSGKCTPGRKRPDVTAAPTTAAPTTADTRGSINAPDFPQGWPFMQQCLHPESSGGLFDFSLPLCESNGATDFPQNARIGIVGGGPAGVSIAKLLHDRGFHNLTIFEKSGYVGGKSKRWVDEKNQAHELGTCYLSGKYECITAWAEQVNLNQAYLDVPRYASSEQSTIRNMTPPNYGLASEYYADFAYRMYQINPEEYAVAAQRAAQAYAEHWVHSMGGVKHIFPMEASLDMTVLNVTFEQWLLERNLQALMPLFFVSMAGQGYGAPSDMPALYGLMWNHPSLVSARAPDGQTHLRGHRMLKEGFQELWSRLVSTTSADVKLNTEVTRISRSQQGVNIHYGNDESEFFDWLIMAAPMPQALSLLSDSTPEEKNLFGGFNYHELTATVFEEKSLGVLPADFELFTWMDRAGEQRDYYRASLLDDGNVTRTMYDKDGDDGALTIRHTSNIKGFENEVFAVLSVSDFRSTNADLTAAIVADTVKYGIETTELHQERWEYMPHYNLEEIIDERKPWRIWDLQGQRRTWWLGSYVSFESVADVLDYNLQLVNARLCTGSG